MTLRLSAILFLSCLWALPATAKPLIAPAEMAAAEASGTLAELYTQARARLVGKDRSKRRDEPLFAELDALGRRLAGPLDEQLRAQLGAARMHNGIVPLSVLSEVQLAAEPMRLWQPSRHDMLSKDLARDSELTRRAITDVEAYIANLPGDAARKHYLALGQLEKLTGDTRYGERRDAMISSLRAQFEAARTTDAFERALTLLDELPPDDSTEATRLELQTQLYERRFNEALADDKPDDAYRLFQTLAASPYFDGVRARIGTTLHDLGNYFVALGANAVAGGNMGDGWRWFAQARTVRARLDGRVSAVPEEKPFVDRVQRGLDRAKQENLWGLALGLALVLQDFDPARPALATDLGRASEEVDRAATRSARIAPFTGAGTEAYAGGIATRVTENLFRTIPEDLRIFSGDIPGGMSVDYVISGSVDKALVDSSTSQLRKTERVITEKGVLTRNPQYDEWLKLAERDRKRVPQPPAQVPVDKREDVSYNVIQLRKIGHFSVAFRVMEAGTGKLVYTDSLTLQRELTNDGNEGVSLGDFSLPARAPDLPGDSEILNQLAAEAATEIGKRLVAQLGNLEQRYAEAARASGGAVQAAQHYASAVAIARRKKVDDAPFLLELKRNATASGYVR